MSVRILRGTEVPTTNGSSPDLKSFILTGHMDYKHASNDGVKISYHERGTGFPLVLLMGFGADGTIWEKHVSVYEQYFRCILIDNRGIGKSDQPQGPYTTAMMAADTIAVMDNAGVQQAAVVGISMGGAIAQQVAICFPERVTKLLLVSTWACFNKYATAVYENLKHIRSLTQGEYFVELLQLWIFAPPYYENSRKQLQQDARAAEENSHPQSKAGFDGQLDACINHNTVDSLHRINIPTLITVGGMDIFTPPEFSNLLHQHIKRSQLVIYPQVGHAHHWENLERFNSESLAFLLTN